MKFKKNRQSQYFYRSALTLFLILLMLASLTACSLSDVKDTSDRISGNLKDQVNQLDEAVDDAVDDAQPSYLADQAETVETVSGEKYAYSVLSEDEKKIYDEIYDAIVNYKEEVTLATTDEEVLDKAYKAVMADYGGLFYTQGYKYNTYTQAGSVVGLSFCPTFTMTEEERDQKQVEIDEVCDSWLSGLSADASDYEKSKYVFEILINNVDYNLSSEDNQNIISVFLNKSTVCQGYADAASYMFDKLGIQSTILTGTAKNDTHAWNMVLLDGQYYLMDITWGNSKFSDADASIVKHINYAYLNITSEEMSATHTADMPFELPECTAMSDNYFVKEGLYFTSFDKEAIGRIFTNGYQNGDIVTIKFGSSDVYQQTYNYFIDEGNIRDYCQGLNSVKYIDNPDALVLTVVF